jgi:hypothetical protein
MTAESLGEDESARDVAGEDNRRCWFLTQALLLADARSGHTQQAEANRDAASSRRNPAARRPKREVAPSPRGYLFSGVTSVDGSSDD